MALKTRSDRLPFDTGIAHRASVPGQPAADSSIITFGPQPNKAIVGANAFAHEAGIHQDGFLKERTTYEIIDPKASACPRASWCSASTAAGMRCSSAARTWASTLTREELDDVYQRFTALADRKKGVHERRDRGPRRREVQTSASAAARLRLIQNDIDESERTRPARRRHRHRSHPRGGPRSRTRRRQVRATR